MSVLIRTTVQGGAPPPVVVTITTTSLPNATVGAAYSATLAASGGAAPYSWTATGVPAGLSLSTAGVLSGTPTTPATSSIVFTATDSSSVASAATTIPLTVNAAGVLNPPSAMWPGNIGLQSFAFAWSPPTSGPTPNSYNVYRDGSLVYSNITPDVIALSFPWIEDRGLTPGSSHTWYATSVLSGTPPTESAPSATVSATLLAVGPSATPVPPAPLTWVASYALPTGTVWTCTNLATGAVTGTGALGNVGCSFQWAINNYAPGDLIVLTAGAAYPTDTSGQGFIFPNKPNPSNLWTYVISSEDPVYKSGGALPAYSDRTTLGAGVTDYAGTGGNWVTSANAAAMPVIQIMAVNGWGLQFQAGANYLRFVGLWMRPPLGGTGTMTLTAAPAAGATSATISGAGFPGPTANGYLLIFSDNEARQVNLTNGQTALTWSPALNNACTTTLNWQTTAYAVSYGVIMNRATSSAPTIVPCESLYFDRCRVGTDPATLYAATNGASLMPNGIQIYGNHILIHQCHIEGLSDNFWMGSSYYGYIGYPTRESHGVLHYGGQNLLIHDSFISTVTEGVFGGGAYVSQANPIQDVTISNCFGWKNPAWFNIGASYDIKNFVEFKHGVRINVHHNVWANNANCIVDQQSGRMQQFWATDVNNTPPGVSPWVAISDIDVHDNLIVHGGCPIYFSGSNGGFGTSGGGNGNPWAVACRQRFYNNMVFMDVPHTLANSASVPYCIQINFNVPDTIYDHNTIIINRLNNTNWLSNGQYACGLFSGSTTGTGSFYLAPTVATANGRQLYPDRCTFTNNILDGAVAWSGSGLFGGGMATFNTIFPAGTAGTPVANGHSIVANNLYITDSISYTGNDFPAVGYTNVGFTAWVDAATVPLPPNISNWNVTVGPHATASTTGTALGAHF